MDGLKRFGPLLAAISLTAGICSGQTPQSPSSTGADVRQLRSELVSTRSELDLCKQQIAELREQLRAVQQRLGLSAPDSQSKSAESQFPTLSDINRDPAAAQAESTSDQDLLAAKVAEYEQTKVESASRYKVKLSGMVLLNAYTNVGNVDNTDLPNLAFRHSAGATSGDLGATLRQTLLGLQVTGPTLAGARTSADLDLDFYGGIPQANYGVTMGALRIRTARVRLDWKDWSVIAGQDVLFFSPLSPTSFATLAEPSLSWSGNLWTWLPQIRAERRWSLAERSSLSWSFGVIDPLTEERPSHPFNRDADPGEATRIPGLATHFGWNGALKGRPATAGVGGYFGKQDWSYQKRIDSWLLTADFEVPFAKWIALSGEVYRGQALGGLGGGIWASALFDGDPEVAATSITALGDVGGWSQLKFTPVDRWEFNTAVGAANPLSTDLRTFSKPRTYAFPPLARNQTFLFNSIYRPRSNLLFALEYRHLRTYGLTGTKNTADHLNLSIGVSF